MANALVNAVAVSRKDAQKLSESIGKKRLQSIMQAAEADLLRRLHRAEGLGGPGKDSFTAVQMRSTLAQVRDLMRHVNVRIAKVVLDLGDRASEKATEDLLKYLSDANKRYTGIASTPLRTKEAAFLDHTQAGVRASILRRLGSSGEDLVGADIAPHPAKPGILNRYGTGVVEKFEEKLQLGLLSKKPWAEIRSDLVGESPFLQGEPMFWAERIVRTETMNASNRASWEATRAADDELGDVVKILVATFDDRTGSDSYACHGQIRQPEEAFETWFGLMQHPPNRPNDREIVVAHRLAWPLPPEYRWRTDSEIASRWRAEGRKRGVPPRPLMTTVPVESFGKNEKKPKKSAEEKKQDLTQG